MSTIKENAINQARSHAKQFYKENEMPDIMEKYAEVWNRWVIIQSELEERVSYGGSIPSTDEFDYYYYEKYHEMLGLYMANDLLTYSGYERDERGRWILKKKTVDSTKKKFRLW